MSRDRTGQPLRQRRGLLAWLVGRSGERDARWLAYLPFERILDQRNERPIA